MLQDHRSIMVLNRWLVLLMATHAMLSWQQQFVLGAATAQLHAFQGQQIEGSDPCPTSDESVYGSSYEAVATKPPSDSDFNVTGEAGLGCQQPVQVCGAVEDVELQCRQTAGCVAFSYDGKCGLLKTSDQPRTPRSGWVTYVLA